MGKAGAAMNEEQRELERIEAGWELARGKDILAIRKEVKPVVKDSKAYRIELAHEFQQAIEALPSIPGKTCGWCGVDVGTVNDHKIVDREPMCNACVSQYFPEGIER
jgi:hypothetical protein